MDHDSTHDLDVWQWVRHTVRLAVEGEPVTWDDLTQVDPGELDPHELVTLMRLADRIRDAAMQVRDAIGGEMATVLGDGAVLRYGAGYVQVGYRTKTTLVDADGFEMWLGNYTNAGEPARILKLWNPLAVRKSGFPDYSRKDGSALHRTFFDVSQVGDPRSSLRPIMGSTPKWIRDMNDGALWVPRKENDD